MTKKITGGLKDDRKLIGSLFTVNVPNDDLKGSTPLRGRLIEITLDGAYCFKITSRNTDVDEYDTKRPLKDVQ